MQPCSQSSTTAISLVGLLSVICTPSDDSCGGGLGMSLTWTCIASRKLSIEEFRLISFCFVSVLHCDRNKPSTRPVTFLFSFVSPICLPLSSRSWCGMSRHRLLISQMKRRHLQNCLKHREQYFLGSSCYIQRTVYIFVDIVYSTITWKESRRIMNLWFGHWHSHAFESTVYLHTHVS